MRGSFRYVIALGLVSACGGSDLVAPSAEQARWSSSMAAAAAKPTAPVILGVSRAGGQATVRWTAVANSAGYQVVSCGEVPLPTVRPSGAATTTWTFIALEPGARYGVKVRAWHDTGAPNNGPFSACATFVGAEWVASIEVTPAAVSLSAGQTTQLMAVLKDRFGAVLTDRPITWSSSLATVATVTDAGFVVAVASGAATVTATSEGKSASARITVEPPGWKQIAATGAIPAAITASAYAEGLDAVFAGEMPDYATGSLWRFDLATSQWTRLTATNWPIGKYRKLIYDASRRRLLTYWDGLGQVYSIPETGGAWTADGSSGNSEQYYEAYAFQNPVSGRLSVFAGYGWGQFRNTLWEWNGSTSWLGMGVQGTVPEPRFGGQASVAVDAAGSRAFFAGRSLGGAAGNYDDLWMLDLRTYTFSNVIGPNTGADARIGAAIAYDGRNRTVYRFGGVSLYGIIPSNTFVSAQPDGGVVHWTTISPSATVPSPRYLNALHYDARRHRLVLVSGLTATGWASDVWVYPLS